MNFKATESPEWFSKGTIYQINLRTFSEKGTLKCIIEELPYLADLGFSIMYLCPIFEEDDSKENRSKRQLASGTDNPKNPYRMNNYFEIDSEYGTMNDLRGFVTECHRLGMRVLLDLVYFHIGPNAPILKHHPEFAKQDENGNILLGEWNFPTLNYKSEGLREYLYANMSYYIGEIDVDGFRCDVGDSIPLDFWEEGLKRIRRIKPDAILIDEGTKREFLSVFHSLYGYYWHETLYDIIDKDKPALFLREMWEENFKTMPIGGNFLRDMDNHDTVTDWPYRIESKIGNDGMEMIIALNYIIDGIPMTYCGNELCDTKYLNMFANRFFMGKYEVTDRNLKNKRREDIFKILNSLKRESDTLLNGKTVWLDNEDSQKIVSFIRETDKEKIVFIGNIKNEETKTTLNFVPEKILIENEVKVNGNEFTISPYGYIVFKAR